MSDSTTTRGRAAIQTPSLGAFSASDAARAALDKPVKAPKVKAPAREFNQEKYVEKIMRAVAVDAASKHPKMVVHLKWPRTAESVREELFAEFEAQGYRLSLEDTPIGTSLCVDYRPAE